MTLYNHFILVEGHVAIMKILKILLIFFFVFIILAIVTSVAFYIHHKSKYIQPFHGIKNITLVKPEFTNWFVYNPSVCRLPDLSLLYTYRVCNWSYRNPLKVKWNEIESHTFLYSPSLDRTWPILFRPFLEQKLFQYNFPNGIEDIRIVCHQSTLFLLGNRRLSNPTLARSMCLIQYPVESLFRNQSMYVDTLVDLKSPKPLLIEKNWMPFFFDNQLHLIYSICPHVILKCDTSSGVCTEVANTPSFAVLKEWRGGAQPLFIPQRNCYLVLSHHRRLEQDYRHRFYTFLPVAPFSILSYSKPFRFPTQRRTPLVQYAAGIVLDGDNILITYGEEDIESLQVRINLTNVFTMLMTPKNKQ